MKDEPSFNDFGHKKTSNDKVVTGSYFLLLPDGRKQIVTYRADDYGYVADVKYEGEAKYPEYKPAYKPAYPAYTKASYSKPFYPSYPRPSYSSYLSYPFYPRPTYPTTAAPVAEEAKVEAAPAVKEAGVAVEAPGVETVVVAEPAVEAAPEVNVAAVAEVRGAAEPKIKATAEPETAQLKLFWSYLDVVRQ